MVYIGMSAFTINSAAFVYHKAGALSTYITDDMVSLILQSPSSQSSCFALTFLGRYQQIPKRIPIRLTTSTFGTFIPEVNDNPTHSITALTFHVNPPTNSICFVKISKKFPGLMMKLLMKTDKSPVVTFEPNSATVQATGTVTAYAIQPNNTLTPLFILNLVGYTTGISRLATSSEPITTPTLYFVDTGHQHQCPSVPQWNEGGSIAYIKQVSLVFFFPQS